MRVSTLGYMIFQIYGLNTDIDKVEDEENPDEYGIHHFITSAKSVEDAHTKSLQEMRLRPR